MDTILIISSLIITPIAVIWAVTNAVTILTGAPYIASHQKAIDDILDLLPPGKDHRAVDLGSGDGRILIQIAERGIPVVGYEINLLLVLASRYRIKQRGLQKLAKVQWKNYWKIPLDQFDIVVIFGMKHLMDRFEKKLKAELQTGAHVICSYFKLPNWSQDSQQGDIYHYIKN
ncbi:MAG TPA: class I SAM-dependent methyltransferase [Candidatus Wirthbacteria bacterium]|nr:class I SAM-dependent methyltransferase [Candidatus Wirthbacteria bacterium]